jgi:hypothetical protein
MTGSVIRFVVRRAKVVLKQGTVTSFEDKDGKLKVRPGERDGRKVRLAGYGNEYHTHTEDLVFVLKRVSVLLLAVE